MGWREDTERMLWRPWNRSPELAFLEPKQREHLWDAAAREARAGCLALVAAVAGLACGLIGGMLLMVSASAVDLPVIWVAAPILILGTPVVACLTAHTLTTRRAVRRLLVLRHLGERMPVCLTCGYDLRGSSASATLCPECGNWIGSSPRATAAR